MKSSLSIRRWAAVISTLFCLAAFARASDAPPVDHYVYLNFLPKASELAQDAKINGLTILRLEEYPDHLIVSYHYPDGHEATLGYALLGTDVGHPQAVQNHPANTQSTTHYTVAARDPEVVYVDRGYPYYPYYGYPYYYGYGYPVTVGIGFGWYGGYYGHSHGGYYGGYHGGYHGGGGHGHH